MNHLCAHACTLHEWHHTPQRTAIAPKKQGQTMVSAHPPTPAQPETSAWQCQAPLEPGARGTIHHTHLLRLCPSNTGLGCCLAAINTLQRWRQGFLEGKRQGFLLCPSWAEVSLQTRSPSPPHPQPLLPCWQSGLHPGEAGSRIMVSEAAARAPLLSRFCTKGQKDISKQKLGEKPAAPFLRPPPVPAVPARQPQRGRAHEQPAREAIRD